MKSSIQRSQAQERRVAKANGAKLQKGSGSGWAHRNDAKTDRLLIEAKCRQRPDAKSITIKLADLEQNFLNAFEIGRLPVLTFELGGTDYYIVPSITWHEMTAT